MFSFDWLLIKIQIMCVSGTRLPFWFMFSLSAHAHKLPLAHTQTHKLPLSLTHAHKLSLSLSLTHMHSHTHLPLGGKRQEVAVGSSSEQAYLITCTNIGTQFNILPDTPPHALRAELCRHI